MGAHQSTPPKNVKKVIANTNKLSSQQIKELLPFIKVYPGPGISRSLADNYKKMTSLTTSEEKEMHKSYTLRLCRTSTYMSLAPSKTKLYIIQAKKSYYLKISKALGEQLYDKCKNLNNTC